MLLLIAVAVAANLHLPLVQAVAWARMYSQYRQHFTPSQALQITFSGQYPCALCKIVQSAEAERDKCAGLITSSERALLLPLPQLAAIRVAVPPSQRSLRLEPLLYLPAGFAQPETPPPRVA